MNINAYLRDFIKSFLEAKPLTPEEFNGTVEALIEDIREIQADWHRRHPN